MAEGNEFWAASGYRLLGLTAEGRLQVTRAFLQAIFRRPELQPVPESCAAEHALRAALLEDPYLQPSPAQLEALADPDARDNYRVVLQLRDLLLQHDSLEAAYLSLFRGAAVRLPPLFVDQLVHVIVRHMLDGAQDAFRCRAAELLFREQRVTLRDGAIMAADDETVGMYAESGGFGSIGKLLVENATPVREVSLDVLDEASQDSYWERSDRFEMVLDLSFTRPGLDALCRVLEAWVAHLMGVAVRIVPVQQIRDERWSWHVGLDAEASALLNDLYEGREVGQERMERLLALFRLEFQDAAAVRPEMAGKPVYLGMAMSADGRLRLKPQNLLVNLPLARPT